MLIDSLYKSFFSYQEPLEIKCDFISKVKAIVVDILSYLKELFVRLSDTICNLCIKPIGSRPTSIAPQTTNQSRSVLKVKIAAFTALALIGTAVAAKTVYELVKLPPINVLEEQYASMQNIRESFETCVRNSVGCSRTYKENKFMRSDDVVDLIGTIRLEFDASNHTDVLNAVFKNRIKEIYESAKQNGNYFSKYAFGCHVESNSQAGTVVCEFLRS